MTDQLLRRTDRAMTSAAMLTLTVAAVCWIVASRQMAGMDMGSATTLGSLGFFTTTWSVMMAAMMLPGAASAVAQHSHAHGLRTAPVFLAAYLAVWVVIGLVAYGVYRPHDSLTAGLLVVAAGLYELTPAKQRYRRRCQEGGVSGLGFGYCCAGSSIGLMVALLAVGVMNIAWMAAISLVVLAQKIIRPKASLDILLAFAIVALGIGIAIS